MTNYLKGAQSARKTAQTSPIPGREADMVENNAGGYTFKLDALGALRRFLILGTEGGTYYADQRSHTLQATKNVRDLLTGPDGVAAVKLIVEVSQGGNAPKNDPALYALAMAAGLGNDETRAFALQVLPLVARTGTHLFQFVNFVEDFRGWGRGLRKAVARWYEGDVDRVAYQIVKYRNREGYTHRDLLRLAHPKATTPEQNALFGFITQGENSQLVPDIVQGYLRAQNAKTVKEVVGLIERYNLPREALPTEFLNEKDVWAAMLPKMPLTAMIRNLGNMSKIGLLTPLSEASKTVAAKLHDTEYLHKSRVHPYSVLVAQDTYQQGHGQYGSGTWDVNNLVVGALEDAFYLAFDNIEPSGKNVMLGIDVSYSMGGGWGMAGRFSAAKVAAVMAMVTARAEPNHFIGGFATNFIDLGITKNDRLDAVMEKTHKSNFGGTDVAVSMQYALDKGIPVDLFAIYTDNETWAGEEHGMQALKEYRKVTGIPAKMVTVGVTATPFTIADPLDAGTMDVVGFDTTAPGLISDFAADRL